MMDFTIPLSGRGFAEWIRKIHTTGRCRATLHRSLRLCHWAVKFRYPESRIILCLRKFMSEETSSSPEPAINPIPSDLRKFILKPPTSHKLVPEGTERVRGPKRKFDESEDPRSLAKTCVAMFVSYCYTMLHHSYYMSCSSSCRVFPNAGWLR